MFASSAPYDDPNSKGRLTFDFVGLVHLDVERRRCWHGLGSVSFIRGQSVSVPSQQPIFFVFTFLSLPGEFVVFFHPSVGPIHYSHSPLCLSPLSLSYYLFHSFSLSSTSFSSPLSTFLPSFLLQSLTPRQFSLQPTAL